MGLGRGGQLLGGLLGAGLGGFAVGVGLAGGEGGGLSGLVGSDAGGLRGLGLGGALAGGLLGGDPGGVGLPGQAGLLGGGRVGGGAGARLLLGDGLGRCAGLGLLGGALVGGLAGAGAGGQRVLVLLGDGGEALVVRRRLRLGALDRCPLGGLALGDRTGDGVVVGLGGRGELLGELAGAALGRGPVVVGPLGGLGGCLGCGVGLLARGVGRLGAGLRLAGGLLGGGPGGGGRFGALLRETGRLLGGGPVDGLLGGGLLGGEAQGGRDLGGVDQPAGGLLGLDPGADGVGGGLLELRALGRVGLAGLLGDQAGVVRLLRGGGVLGGALVGLDPGQGGALGGLLGDEPLCGLLGGRVLGATAQLGGALDRGLQVGRGADRRLRSRRRRRRAQRPALSARRGLGCPAQPCAATSVRSPDRSWSSAATLDVEEAGLQWISQYIRWGGSRSALSPDLARLSRWVKTLSRCDKTNAARAPHAGVMSTPHFDVLIIGAGLSGIGTACQVKDQHPGKSIAVLERRERLGGTWDLFRYPGIRSDSDMFTFGYEFRPWVDTKVLADGASIRQYIADTAAEYGIDECVRYGLKIVAADWSSSEQPVDPDRPARGDRRDGDLHLQLPDQLHRLLRLRRRLPAGPSPASRTSPGECVHPQHWPEDLDYTGKKVVVIGSGATAVTLVPSMAGDGRARDDAAALAVLHLLAAVAGQDLRRPRPGAARADRLQLRAVAQHRASSAACTSPAAAGRSRCARSC